MKRLICLSTLLLPACGVFGLSESERDDLHEFTHRSTQYFEARKYRKAIDQTQRGLEIDPDNYDLKGRQAMSYLQLSYQPTPNNQNDLRTAERIFGEIIDARSEADHDPHNILGFAIALHNRARVETDNGIRVRKALANPPENPATGESVAADDKILEARAVQHESAALSYDKRSVHYFQRLLDGNTAPSAHRRICHKYLMALAYRKHDLSAAIEFGEKNLELNATEVGYWQHQYANTAHVAREPVLRKALKDLRTDELKVRSRLIAYYRENKDYDHAIRHLNVILGAKPSCEDYYLRGDCFRALENHKSAREDFSKFLGLGKLPQTHPIVKDAYEYLYGPKK